MNPAQAEIDREITQLAHLRMQLPRWRFIQRWVIARRMTELERAWVWVAGR